MITESQEAYLQQLIDNPPKHQKIATPKEDITATRDTLRTNATKVLRSWVDPNDLRLHISAIPAE